MVITKIEREKKKMVIKINISNNIANNDDNSNDDKNSRIGFGQCHNKTPLYVRVQVFFFNIRKI